MRLLVVEDESLIAILIEETLVRLGHILVASAVRVGPAVELARTAIVDAAILDINVHGEPIYPVATILVARQIPFLFVTGYNTGEIDERFRECPTVRKPFTGNELGDALGELQQQPAKAP
jgi:CheY-like chemotaxis protein